MRNILLRDKHFARASRGVAGAWRLLVTLALILLTLLNATQGLLCTINDADRGHHHGNKITAIEQSKAVDLGSETLTIADKADGNAADCLHCAGMHAPLFAVNLDALAFHVSKLSQTFPALVETMPPTRLSAHYRPPIYS